MIAGIDEVGYGSWAGPVCAVAAIFRDIPTDEVISLCQDSKQFSEKKRFEVFNNIVPFLSFGIGLASVKEIDTFNIKQATFLAMRRAFSLLFTDNKISHVIIDGKQDPEIGIPSTMLIKADETCPIVSAASIIAKVYRDFFMIQLHYQDSRYNFHLHKGYGTIQHQFYLSKYGLSIWHRKSFQPMKSFI